MKFTAYEYTIAAHWVCPLEYADYSDMTDQEADILAAFLLSLPGPGHWDWPDDSPEFAMDEISGLYAECYRATYHAEIQEAAA